ncbi:CF298 protein, partial [Fregetta grallaria]|nr:CF298 protein [Fregetta grallaria]
MVRLHVKRGDESQFLLEVTGSARLADLAPLVARIYNGRLKVQRLCSGTGLIPPAAAGSSIDCNLVVSLLLCDLTMFHLLTVENNPDKSFAWFLYSKCRLLNMHLFFLAPNEKMQQVIKKTIEEAKALISRKQVQANVCVNMEMVKDALDQLRGAVMIVYPMGLPPHDPIRMEFEDKEDLSGTHAGLEVIEESEAQLWWAGKELRETKLLSDYVGKNEKTTIIVKIQKKGQGAPGREPLISHEEQKQMMLHYYRKQEELKKLEEDDDDSFLNAEWADNHALKRQFHGVKDIKWGPR